MKKYKIIAQLEMEIEAENEEQAKDKAEPKFKELEEGGAKITEARVVDVATGYFIK